MKPFTNNPRKMSARQAKRLRETMAEFGDLSGIVHDLDTDEIIGGNQRSNVADLMRQKPTITENFDTPLSDGTAALGYFDVQGRRFAYRAIRGWDADKRTRANLVANAGGGSWDADLLANIDAELLKVSGFGDDMLNEARNMTGALIALIDSEQVDYSKEWQGMPEFEQEDLGAKKSIKVNFATLEDMQSFSELIGQNLTEKTRSIWYPAAEKINMTDVYKNES